MGRWARKPVNHTSWVAVVTPTDRPKSVRNRCLIELFVALFVLSLCPFDISVGVGAFVIGLSQTGTLKNPTKCLWRWEPDRRSYFFFSPPAHLCAVTYMTEISLIVTLNKQFNSTQLNNFLFIRSHWLIHSILYITCVLYILEWTIQFSSPSAFPDLLLPFCLLLPILSVLSMSLADCSSTFSKIYVIPINILTCLRHLFDYFPLQTSP